MRLKIKSFTVILFVSVWFRIFEKTCPFQLIPFPTWNPPRDTTCQKKKKKKSHYLTKSIMLSGFDWNQKHNVNYLSVQIEQIKPFGVENSIWKLRQAPRRNKPAMSSYYQKLHHIP